MSRRRVALMVETSSAYGRRILRGVRRYVHTHQSWSIFLEQRSLLTRMPRWLDEWAGDGIISRSTTEHLAEAVARSRVPMVDLTDRFGPFGQPQVWSDDAAIARLGLDHLRERGFKRFAFCGFAGESWSRRRLDAFVAAAGDGCPAYESPWVGDDAVPWEVDQRRIAAWLAELPRPVGIMACNDLRGQYVLEACRGLGLAVPEEVAVVGVDDEEEVCDLCEPPLSSIVPNAELVGYKAAEILDGLMAGRPAEADRLDVPPLGVTTRQSTDILAIDDPDVAAAVRFIREHACNGIVVDDVLVHVPVSRSILERRFRQALACSPQGLIRRMQLKRVKQLLVDTELPPAQDQPDGRIQAPRAHVYGVQARGRRVAGRIPPEDPALTKRLAAARKIKSFTTGLS